MKNTQDQSGNFTGVCTCRKIELRFEVYCLEQTKGKLRVVSCCRARGLVHNKMNDSNPDDAAATAATAAPF